MHITVPPQIVDMLQSALNGKRRDIIHSAMCDYAVTVALVQASLLIATVLNSQGSEICFNKIPHKLLTDLASRSAKKIRSELIDLRLGQLVEEIPPPLPLWASHSHLQPP